MDPDQVDAAIRALVEAGASRLEIYRSFARVMPGDNATPAEIEEARTIHCTSTECDVEIDDDAWASRVEDKGSYNGLWVHAWVWLDRYPPDEDEDG